MRKHILSAVAAVSLLATFAIVSFAAYSASRIKADIPFAFIISGKQLPAGQYVVSRPSANGLATISNTETGEAAVFLVRNGRRLKGDAAQLTFNVYGEQRFLHEISDGTDDAHEVPMSKAERKLRQGAPNYLAQVVTVAAHAE